MKPNLGSEMFIAGEWTPGPDQEEVLRAFDSSPIGSVPIAGPQEVDSALEAAAVGAGRMRRMAGHERAEILNRAADLADERVEEIALTICLEAGKLLSEARGEAARAGAIMRVSAYEGAHCVGEVLPLDASPGTEGKFGYTIRQPCGVVVAITPFNYPALLLLHKLAPALAAGNAVIIKPARQTPFTAMALVSILLEAGLPPEAVQLVTGAGSELGPQLCADRRVRKISFTGSTVVGESIAREAGIKRLSLELGSSCPTLVLADADIERAAAAIVTGGYVNAGQVCISVQRVLVERKVHADLLDALIPRVEQLRTGDPLNDATTIGTLVDAGEAVRVEDSIEKVASRGARVLTGGEREGSIVQPAVVDGVAPSDPFARDELFGPAVAICAVENVDEAIRVANDSDYGLGAGVFTQDIAKAMRFVRDVDAGTLHVNWTPLWRADPMPYGGLKASGFGKEGPRYAVEEMTEAKTVIIHEIA